MITYDRSQRTVVVLCACGWRDVAGTKDHAACLALAHIARAHPPADELYAMERGRVLHAARERDAYRRRDTPKSA